jgi:DNA-binding response OmpR family regulator
MIRSAAVHASFQVTGASTPEEAAAWLDEHEPQVMLVDTSSIDPESAASSARARHAQVPVLAWVRQLDALSFASAFSWGADDVVHSSNERGLLGRLRSLPKTLASEPSARGSALVAEEDKLRRISLGRVLRNAGYSITFAVSNRDVCSFTESSDFDVVVLNSELVNQPRMLIEAAREQGKRATWIVTCAPRHLREQRAALAGLKGATVADGYTPPENVLFVSNELLHARFSNQRLSARLLYGTLAAFRGAGRHSDEFGYTYNISEAGLYVRTLMPPEDAEVWLELNPPRSERRVRLVGKIAWRRDLAHSQTATVPPGFGLEIVDGARADMQAWRAGYAALAEALG